MINVYLLCYVLQWTIIFLSGDMDSCSQATLDDEEKSEISVQTKAPEIIGRLTCVMWIYCNGMA